ncbi:HAD family hydrolase [Lederbergia sp. NSJ-179]|uniref:HAD family hydrolase n=1 Tax=Lederbergia sp. NSJ-179 TaxID=2931402 RepID=UPI001FD1014A|nr:HAD family hydrolase [Lederbergia sp. NSJ-179]MCJ7842587.1 HAD family hydrolase [Lederbergia sp. NSJ-179]
MSTYQVLFLDIDGTILKPDHTYDASTKKAIKQVQEIGLEVFLATGRPLHEIRDLAKELNVDSFIGYNGALALYKEEPVVNEPMAEETVLNFLEIAKKNGHEMVLYTSEKNYFTSLDKSVVKHFIKMFQLKENNIFTEKVADQILGATLINLTEEDRQLYQFDPTYHLSQVNVEALLHCYDVIRDRVNKGGAISKILDVLQVPKEKAIAFGDGMNDKEMLQTVGEGFAMGNAHPDLFQYAKHKTTSVLESGIFNGLKSLHLIKE